MHFTPEDGGLPQELPLTVDFATGFYFHREGAGLVFGGREPTIEGVASHGTARLPVLAELPIQSSWWGFYEMSPDHNAIVGEVAQPRRFLYATGFSGHGFQQAPAVGEHLAELVVGAEPTLDLSRSRSTASPAAASGTSGSSFAALRPRPTRRVDAEHRAARQRRPRRARGAHRPRAEESRRLGEQVAQFPLDACVHTRFPRTRETAEIALGGREDVRSSRSRCSTTSTSATSKARAWRRTARGSTATPATCPSRAARASTTPRAGTPRLSRAARRAVGSVLVVCHEIPMRYALNGAAGPTRWTAHHEISNAVPISSTEALERAVSDRAVG